MAGAIAVPSMTNALAITNKYCILAPKEKSPRKSAAPTGEHAATGDALGCSTGAKRSYFGASALCNSATARASWSRCTMSSFGMRLTDEASSPRMLANRP